MTDIHDDTPQPAPAPTPPPKPHASAKDAPRGGWLGKVARGVRDSFIAGGSAYTCSCPPEWTEKENARDAAANDKPEQGR